MSVRTILLSVVAVAALVLPALAHHSMLEFAGGQKTTLHGVITKVEWSNPHVYCHMDVKDAVSRKTIDWEIEMGSPGALGRRGIRKDNLTAGAVVIIIGRRAADGTYRMSPDQVIFSKP